MERLAFSFLIISVVLIWEGYRAAGGRLGPVSEGRVMLYFVAATLSAVLGIAGIRQRHRSRGDDDSLH